MVVLRDYQERAISEAIEWFEGNDGTLVTDMPPGAGKSHVIAGFCTRLLQEDPTTHILIVTFQLELVEQDFSKIIEHWEDAPASIYCASLNQRTISQVTVASIMSVYDKADALGTIDFVIIDECHRVNVESPEPDMYRSLIDALKARSPSLRVWGLTGTPYRLNHGRIEEGDHSIWADILKPVTVYELIEAGHLSRIFSTHAQKQIKLDGVKTVRGDFTISDLDREITGSADSAVAVTDAVARLEADGRKLWLFFCVSLAHAAEVGRQLTKMGYDVRVITGDSSKENKEYRVKAVWEARSGKIRALVGVDTLTTGLDIPPIDGIVMLRPTKSVALYVQMAGRGLRLSPGKSDCRILDYVGNISRHGPVTRLMIDEPAPSDGEGVAPCKACQLCGEVVHAAVRTCPACGTEFPLPPPPTVDEKPEEDIDILLGKGTSGRDLSKDWLGIRGWRWDIVPTRAGFDALMATFYPHEGASFGVWYTVNHAGRGGEVAWRKLRKAANGAGVKVYSGRPLGGLIFDLNQAPPPTGVVIERNKGFVNLKDIAWD